MTYPDFNSERVWKPTASRFEPDTLEPGPGEVFLPEVDPVWPDMSRAVFVHIGRYIRHAANLIGLRDWHLLLSWEYLDGNEEIDDTLACVNVTYGQKSAVIRLCKGFALLPYREQQHVIVHELFHLHLDVMEKLSHSALEGRMSSDAYAIWHEVLHESIEKIVDGISREVAGMLPGIEDNWKGEPKENEDA